jgi:hypothetical protein
MESTLFAAGYEQNIKIYFSDEGVSKWSQDYSSPSVVNIRTIRTTIISAEHNLYFSGKNLVICTRFCFLIRSLMMVC